MIGGLDAPRLEVDTGRSQERVLARLECATELLEAIDPFEPLLGAPGGASQ